MLTRPLAGLREGGEGKGQEVSEGKETGGKKGRTPKLKVWHCLADNCIFDRFTSVISQ